MTLREELEILRGEPIKVWEGDPKDIPCIETSDPELLCKHPVVSVHMITYNHEPYIRQAIEGVMMQKTDFEFELVIGEDCSTDRTREICFEYQKKYPDKIRVLWWHKNSYKFPHPAGGNSRRNLAHCRGEFIAICEGDDYWIDPLKLQKQVDVMRKYPNVGFCFCGSRRFYQEDGRYDLWNDGYTSFRPGVQQKDRFFTLFMFGNGPTDWGFGDTGFIMTATTMIRKNLLDHLYGLYEIFKWRLRLGDATMWLGASSLMNGYYLPDVVSVYRIANTGMFQNPVTHGGVRLDGHIVRMFYFKTVWGLPLKDYPRLVMHEIVRYMLSRCRGGVKYARYAMRIIQADGEVRRAILRWYSMPYWFCAITGCLVRYVGMLPMRLFYWGSLKWCWSGSVRDRYNELSRE